MTVSTQTHEQVIAVLDRMVEGARHGDDAALAGLAAPEFAGFGFECSVGGPADLRAALAGRFVLDGIQIWCEGTIAWVTARMVFTDAPGSPGRFTAVLRGTGHAWLVAQIHASLPARTRPDSGP